MYTNYMIYPKLFAIAFLVFLGIDMIWLTLVAKNFYAQQIGYLMTKTPNLLAALIFYLLFVAGLVFFVIMPAIAKGSWQYVLLSGAFFGLVTYATYDLTNLATVANWPILITIVDLIWGTSLSATVSIVTYLIAKKIGL